MQTYEELHERFPSKKLVRKIFSPRAKPNAICIVMMRTFLQSAILTVVENRPDSKQTLTRNGKCLLHRFVDAEKIREFTFESESRKRYATRRLARELRKVVSEGVDVEGYGTILVEDGEVVFIPAPVVPRYGNILLFDPYFS